MKSLFSSRFILPAVCLIFISQFIKAQDDLTQPTAAKNEAMEMLMGTWKSDPYDMMGSKWTETAVHSMKHSGQYMFIDISTVDDKGQSYTVTVIMKSDAEGNLKGWSFDNWGMAGTYTGKSSKNKITVTGKSDWGTETREIEINGNSMVHKVVSTMTGKDGKEMTMNSTITYKKQ